MYFLGLYQTRIQSEMLSKPKIVLFLLKKKIKTNLSLSISMMAMQGLVCGVFFRSVGQSPNYFRIFTIIRMVWLKINGTW